MTPMNPGDPGLETWKNLDAARHGGGHPWVPGSFDPETRLYIIGTGNPTPAYTSAPRGEGLDNLYTCALVADPRRYRQDGLALSDLAARHARLGLGADARAGRRRDQRPQAQAGADGGQERLLLHGRSRHRRAHRHQQVLDHGQLGEGPQRQRASRCASRRRTITSPARSSRRANVGASNWPPPAFSPDTGLFYVNAADMYAMYYLSETSPRGAIGLGGKDERRGRHGGKLPRRDRLQDRQDGVAAQVPDDEQHGARERTADDRRTAAVWRRRIGQPSSRSIRRRATILWHSAIGQVSNAPQTYMLDGKQYVLAAAGDTLYAFALY